MLLGVGLVVWLAFFRVNPITLENYEKITANMTEADVRALLGSPSQTVEAGSNPALELVGARAKAYQMNRPNTKTMVWKRGDDVLYVSFVNGKAFLKVIKVGNTTRGQTL
jgi:hypothetical protein